MEISDKIITALIAGGVSIIVTLIGTFSSFSALKRKFSLETSDKYKEKLIELRMQEYPKAFGIMGNIKFNRENRSTKEELSKVRDELKEWWLGPAAILLSQESISKYYECEKAFKNIISDQAEEISQQKIDDLYLANRGFRISLRSDLKVIYEDLEPGRYN
ncbi:hypothetical protein [uncultured Pseudoalteromonas sp.]|uniref:hypothetical protein n=1 Tax=uncultured Pseudoalteromonas sp. TaxID=114053 RepID=UPI0025876980|nr:hypothetical protein [uncultured Pseudoalteromonas sp.]